MKLEHYAAISGAIGIFFGLGYLLAPELIGGSIWKFKSPTELMIVRFVGAYLFVWGAIGFKIGRSKDTECQRALLGITVLGHALTVVLFLTAMREGIAGRPAAINVVFSVVLGLGAAYYLSTLKQVRRR